MFLCGRSGKRASETSVFVKSIGFTGTRQILSSAQDKTLLDILARLRDRGFTTLRHGDCLNADTQAHIHAGMLGLHRISHPPSNGSLRAFNQAEETLPAKDYLARNRDIVDGASILVACPDGPERTRSGTWSTIRYARSRNIPIIVVWPSGTVTSEKGSSSVKPE